MELYASLTSDPVSRLDTFPPLQVDPDERVAHAIELMQQHRVGSVLVCREERLVGIFTERDVLRIIAQRESIEVPVGSVMTSSPVTVRTTDTVAAAIERMHRGGYRRMPIVDGENRPLAMITVRRVVRYLVEHFPAAVYNLPPVAEHTTRDREGA